MQGIKQAKVLEGGMLVASNKMAKIFSIIILLVIIMSFVMVGVKADVFLDNSTIYWPLSHNASDVVGSNDLTVTAGTPDLSSDGQGVIDEAYYIDGSEYWTSTSNVAFDQFTGCIWIRGNSSANAQMLSTQDASGFSGWGLRYIGGVIQLNMHDGVAQNLDYTVAINDNTWHHICGSSDGTNAYLYFDGVERDSAASGKSWAARPITVGSRASAIDYIGYINEGGIWNSYLNEDNISYIYNSGAGRTYPFTPTAPPVTSNATSETTVRFFQPLGTVTVNSATYQTIYSGTFEIDNATDAYASYAINVFGGGGADNTCRVLINGVDYGTEASRTNTIGEWGAMYLTSTNFTLPINNYTSTLECKRTTGGNFGIANSVGIIHIMQNANNESISYGQGTTSQSLLGNDLDIANYTYNITSNVTGDKVLSLVLDGEFSLYSSLGSFALINVSFGNTFCGTYKRSVNPTSFGSGGFTCIIANATNTTSALVQITSQETGLIEDVDINTSFFIKEFVMDYGNANHTSIINKAINSTSWVNITSLNIENTEFASGDLIVKSGLSVKSTSGASEIDLRVTYTDDQGTILRRDTTFPSVGMVVSQYAFSGVSEGNYTVNVEGMCDNGACDVYGGDLIAYMSNDLTFTPNSINVTIKDEWTNTSLSNFSVLVASTGNIFNTENGVVAVFSDSATDTLTIIKEGYFNQTITHNMSNDLLQDIHQNEVTFNATQLITGNYLTGVSFIVDGLNTTTWHVNEGTHNITATKSGYWPLSSTFNVTTLENTSKLIEDMYNAIINITVREFISNNSVSDFNITTDYGVTLSSNNNSFIELPIIQNTSVRYLNLSNNLGNQFATVKDYPVSTSVFSSAETIFVYTFNSVLLSIYDAATLLLIDDRNVTISTINNISSFTNMTDTGEIVVDFLSPTNYELRFNATNYNTRSVFVTVLNDSTQNVSVYMTMTSNATTEIQVVEVFDTSNSEVEGAIVWLQKEVIGGSSQWITVQEAQTDFEGKTSVFVERDTSVFYRFAVVYDGAAVPILPTRNLFTGQTSFIPAVTETVRLIVDLETASSDPLPDRLGITSNLTYANYNDGSGIPNNNTVVCSWVDARNSIIGARLLITGRYLLNGTTFDTISDTTTNTTFGTINYTFTPINNTIYEIKCYAVYTGRQVLLETDMKEFNVTVVVERNTGLLYAVLVLMVVALLTVPFRRDYGIVVSAVLTLSSLFILTIFGILQIPTAIITSLIAFAIIIFVKVKGNNDTPQ